MPEDFLHSVSESSRGSSAATSSSTLRPVGDLGVRQLWHRWRPGWYAFVLAVNAAAGALFFPVPVAKCQRFDGPSLPPWQFRTFFSVLMLASLGSGCMAAYLRKRAGASAHVQSASGYATLNWSQSLLATMAIRPDCFEYGILRLLAENSFWFSSSLAGCRGIFLMLASVWMQQLVASRLELLELSSRQAFCGRCIRWLVRLQVCTASLAAIPMSLAICYSNLLDAGATPVWDLWSSVIVTATLAVIVAVVFNVLASIMAVCSLIKSFLVLRRVLSMAKLTDASFAVQLSLRRARRLAGLQAMGISFSLVLSILVIPCVLHSNIGFGGRVVLQQVLPAAVAVQVMDVLGNALAAVLLSGSHRLPKVDQMPGQQLGCRACRCQTKAPLQKERDWRPEWRAKVEELSMRGMTLRSLLCFYQEMLLPMRGWKYAPRDHKTRDVVRRAIIPLTSGEESAYAVSALNKDGPRRAQVMVTHNWGNCFKDLLAAIISDAFQECSFAMASKLLEEDCAFVCEILAQSSCLDDTYWICAFAVNQHICICHSNPYDRDPLTNELHPVCSCSSINISDPDGKSTVSEINKFDDMMYHLSATGGCRQVIAVDRTLDLFNRAWCVAEIAEANRLQMNQVLQVAARASIMQRACSLEKLDIRSMRASSEVDKELILKKIENSMSIEEFNTELQSLIFDSKSGLLTSWNAMDALQQVGEVGRLIRWGLADAGTGKVWNAWEAS